MHIRFCQQHSRLVSAMFKIRDRYGALNILIFFYTYLHLCRNPTAWILSAIYCRFSMLSLSRIILCMHLGQYDAAMSRPMNTPAAPPLIGPPPVNSLSFCAKAETSSGSMRWPLSTARFSSGISGISEDMINRRVITVVPSMRCLHVV